MFNLGSIQKRIIDWDIEGYRSIFEQDVVLWGPIPDERFIFENKEIPLVRIYKQTSVKELFDALPEGWYPDILTCETSVLNYVPDIYLCPVRTILFTRDAWGDTIYNRSLVDFFDFLSHGVIDFSVYGKYRVQMLPVLSFAVTLPHREGPPADFANREIDVLCIANYNRAFYHDRYKILYKLAVMARRDLIIRYIRGIKRSEISDFYSQSKIVIDWSYTLSNRSYEAALNGCLLFSHEDNKAVSELWVPWEEYIPYNEHNLYDLINHYINNHEHARTVIKNASEKVRQIPSGYGEHVWEQVKKAMSFEVDIKGRTGYIATTSVSKINHALATPLYFNYNYHTDYPEDWKNLYFSRIDKAIYNIPEHHPTPEPLIEATRMAFLLKKQELFYKYASKLQELLPDYGWLYYLKGRVLFEQKEHEKAIVAVRKAIQCASDVPELLQKYTLPFTEKDNTCDYRRITDYMWQSIYNHNNEFQVKSLLHMSSDLEGDIFQNLGKFDKAMDSYSQALKHLAVPDSLYKLYALLYKSRKFDYLNDTVTVGLQDSPYDDIIVFNKSLALLNIKESKRAFLVLKEHYEAVKKFENYKRLSFVKRSLGVVLNLKIFGKRINSSILIRLIEILKNKTILK